MEFNNNGASRDFLWGTSTNAQEDNHNSAASCSRHTNVGALVYDDTEPRGYQYLQTSAFDTMPLMDMEPDAAHSSSFDSTLDFPAGLDDSNALLTSPYISMFGHASNTWASLDYSTSFPLDNTPVEPPTFLNTMPPTMDPADTSYFSLSFVSSDGTEAAVSVEQLSVTAASNSLFSLSPAFSMPENAMVHDVPPSATASDSLLMEEVTGSFEDELYNLATTTDSETDGQSPDTSFQWASSPEAGMSTEMADIEEGRRFSVAPETTTPSVLGHSAFEDASVPPIELVNKLKRHTDYAFKGIVGFHITENREGSYWAVVLSDLPDGHDHRFVCAIDTTCNTISTSSRGMNRHFRSKAHAGANTTIHKCNHNFPCNKTFTRQDVLKRHVEKVKHEPSFEDGSQHSKKRGKRRHEG